MPTELKRQRKPKARPTEVVLGAIDERLISILPDESNHHHIARLIELMDELRRSLNRTNEDGDE